MEGPPKLPNKIEQKPLTPISKPKGLEGEIITPGAEDPMVLQRFEELPAEFREQWKQIPTKIRRLIVGDQDILGMSYEKLYELSLKTSEQYAALKPLQEFGNKGDEYRGNSELLSKDITPKPITRALEEKPNKLLGDK